MLDQIILNALKEDVGPGDYSTLAAIDEKSIGIARLIVKEDGILAGIGFAKRVYELTDPNGEMDILVNDGQPVSKGDLAFVIKGSAQNILTTERLILNAMQRMSAIATHTHRLVQKVAHTSVKLLDTRKTTPGFRFAEKWAVQIGGGHNHRFGLYDRIMLKDNHIDFCGGLSAAVEKTQAYLIQNKLDLPIEVEVRNGQELNEAILLKGIDRIMLDNFSPDQIRECLPTIPPHFEVEASGGINEGNLIDYAETGVHFISIGALTHHVKSLDMSLKAIIQGAPNTGD